MKGFRSRFKSLAADPAAFAFVANAATLTIGGAIAPASSERVQISAAATSWLTASNVLRSAWVSPGGDWIDGADVFNGSTPTITQFLAATGAHTFDISGIDGDLYLTGPVNMGSILIDGVAATAFWVDPSQGTPPNLAMPSLYGDPVFVLNPTRGTTLSVTTSSPNQTIRIEKVAGPLIPTLPMVSTRADPDIASFQPTSQAQIESDLGPGAFAVPYAYDASFSTFNGMPYIRFAVTPANERGISWFLDFTPSAEVYARYCLFIEDDVSDGMDNLALGCKLPGISARGGNVPPWGSGNTTDPAVSWRMEHGVIDAANLDVYSIVDYTYSAEGPSVIGDLRSMFRAGRWYVVEQYAKANTFSGSTANSDGVSKIWINGNLISHLTNRKWFGDGETTRLFDFFHANFYHGGTLHPPTQNVHYRLGEIAISTAYIGPPVELQDYDPDAPEFPAWVPAPGTIATVGLNDILSDTTVNPELNAAVNPNYPSPGPWHGVSGIGPATVYSGAVFAPLLGDMGSLLMTFSGHFAYNDNSVYRYDVATRLFSALTRPYGSLQVPFRNGVTSFTQLLGGDPDAWYSDVSTGEYYASGARASTLQDQPSAFQSYNGNVYLPPGVGGAGAKGALFTPVRYALTPNGSVGGCQPHILDLAAAEADPAVGWSRFGSMPSTPNAGQNNACLAQSRDKVYLLPGASGSTTFLRAFNLTARTITDYSVVGGGGYIGHALVSNLCYSEQRDLLFVIGWVTPIGAGFGFGIQVLDVSGGTVSVSIPSTPMTGTEPIAYGGGGWVEAHQAFYYYTGVGGSKDVYKITPPVGDPRANAWNCELIPLTGDTPFVEDGGVGAEIVHGSRFLYAPAADSHMWWAGNSHAMQAFRLPS